MYLVLDKDIIKSDIIPHLPVVKRAYKTKTCLVEILNSILNKLKKGYQWNMLPTSFFFSKCRQWA